MCLVYKKDFFAQNLYSFEPSNTNFAGVLNPRTKTEFYRQHVLLTCIIVTNLIINVNDLIIHSGYLLFGNLYSGNISPSENKQRENTTNHQKEKDVYLISSVL